MKRMTLVAAAVLALAAPVVYAQGMQYTTPPDRKIEAPKGEAGKAESPGAAPAFNVEQPKPKCEDPGAYPGRVGMQTEDRRNKFLKAIDTYKTCMLNFVEERKAVIKANETSARAAIEEFNTRMKRYNEEQEKAKE